MAGTLKRAPGGFLMIGDDGQRWRLELPRTPVDLVEKRVRVHGVAIDEGVLQVIAIAQDAG